MVLQLWVTNWKKSPCLVICGENPTWGFSLVRGLSVRYLLLRKSRMREIPYEGNTVWGKSVVGKSCMGGTLLQGILCPRFLLWGNSVQGNPVLGESRGENYTLGESSYPPNFLPPLHLTFHFILIYNFWKFMNFFLFCYICGANDNFLTPPPTAANLKKI